MNNSMRGGMGSLRGGRGGMNAMMPMGGGMGMGMGMGMNPMMAGMGMGGGFNSMPMIDTVGADSLQEASKAISSTRVCSIKDKERILVARAIGINMV